MTMDSYTSADELARQEDSCEIVIDESKVRAFPTPTQVQNAFRTPTSNAREAPTTKAPVNFSESEEEEFDDPDEGDDDSLIDPVLAMRMPGNLAAAEAAEELTGEVESDKSVTVVEAPKKIASTKLPADLTQRSRWPQYSSLIRDYPSITMALLRSVEDVNAQSELKALNTENIKGNKWANLHFVCFGSNRGSLSGRLPVVEKPTLLKKKVMEIWKYLEANNEDDRIQGELLGTGIRQYQEYKDMEIEVEGGKDKLKKRNEELRQKMQSYERKQGALPDGAKANEPGRANHSTNCGLGEPASYSYVQGSNKENSVPKEITAATVSTPGRSKKASPVPSSSGRSSSVNQSAIESLSGFDSAFSILVDNITKGNKRESESDDIELLDLSAEDKNRLVQLRSKKRRTLEKITTYQPFIDTDSTAMKEYRKRLAILAKIDKKIDAITGDDESLSGDSHTTLG